MITLNVFVKVKPEGREELLEAGRGTPEGQVYRTHKIRINPQ
jgi:hypothetical protein